VAGKDAVQDLLVARLRGLHQRGKLPLLSLDVDDTFLPFGQVITETELDILFAYLDAGGQLTFNTLAPKEWFYRTVIDRLVSASSRKNCAHLLGGLHWIVSGGREIFVYDPPNHSYRRTHTTTLSTKAAGLLHLLRNLDANVALLALYGDRFEDPGNDGCALGIPEIPLIVNVGADQHVAQSNTGQHFANAVEKGPATTLRHVALLTAALRGLLPRVRRPASLPGPASRQPWRFETGAPAEKPRTVEVKGPGFLWSWTDQGLSYLGALAQQLDQPVYTARLPSDVAGFTFFWTGGPDTATGQSPGHWEGRDFHL
jgi:hypothetical protein